MRCCEIKSLACPLLPLGRRMPGDSVLRSVRAVFVAAVMYVAAPQCEILRRAIALNSILREILEF